jgi:hypothetical protein
MFKYLLFTLTFGTTLLFLLLLSNAAFAAYDRHDGSQYSCNEINSERAYAKKFDKKAFKKLDKEYRKYCK